MFAANSTPTVVLRLRSTGLVVAALRTAAPGRDPALRIAATLVPVAAAGAAVTAAASVFALTHWDAALDYAATHTTFMAGAAFIAVGAMAMSTATALALSRP